MSAPPPPHKNLTHYGRRRKCAKLLKEFEKYSFYVDSRHFGFYYFFILCKSHFGFHYFFILCRSHFGFLYFFILCRSHFVFHYFFTLCKSHFGFHYYFMLWRSHFGFHYFFILCRRLSALRASCCCFFRWFVTLVSFTFLFYAGGWARCAPSAAGESGKGLPPGSPPPPTHHLSLW